MALIEQGDSTEHAIVAWARGQGMAKEHSLNRIELPRPRRTSCCMVTEGTMEAQTASDPVGLSS